MPPTIMAFSFKNVAELVPSSIEGTVSSLDRPLSMDTNHAFLFIEFVSILSSIECQLLSSEEFLIFKDLHAI